MTTMTEVLALVLARAETSSSIYIGLEDALKYGDISRVEHGCAERMIKDWFRKNETLALENFAVKRQAFKQFIKECKANESMRAR